MTKHKVGEAKQINPQYVPYTGSLDDLEPIWMSSGLSSVTEPVAEAQAQERSVAQAAGDTLLGGIRSTLIVPKVLGTGYGLVTGKMDNYLLENADRADEILRNEYSDPLKKKIDARTKKIKAADGLVDTATTAFGETVGDAALALDTVASNLGSLVTMGGMGAAAKLAVAGRGLRAAQAAGPASQAALEAVGATASKVGANTALGAGSVLQGSDVAADVYKSSMAKPDAAWVQNKDFMNAVAKTDGSDEAVKSLKQEFALDAARVALPAAAALSLATGKLPGGSAIENALVNGLGRTAGKGGFMAGVGTATKTLVGETGSEALEEGGGAGLGNVAKQHFVDPNQDLTENVGENTGMGAAGGFLMGGVPSAMQGYSAYKGDEQNQLPTIGGQVPPGNTPNNSGNTPITPPTTPPANPANPLNAVQQAAQQPGSVLSRAAVAGNQNTPVTPPVATPTAATQATAQSATPTLSNEQIQFADLLDTDDVYGKWSNVRDGSDREEMRTQMEYISGQYLDGIKNQGLAPDVVKADLKDQFKWFKSATPEQQDQAVSALYAQAGSPTPITPADEFTQAWNEDEAVKRQDEREAADKAAYEAGEWIDEAYVADEKTAHAYRVAASNDTENEYQIIPDRDDGFILQRRKAQTEAAQTQKSDEWKDSFGNVHYQVNAPISGGKATITEVIDQEQAGNIGLRFTDSKGNPDRQLTIGLSQDGTPYWFMGDTPETAIREAIGDQLFNTIAGVRVKNTTEYAELLANVRTAVGELQRKAPTASNEPAAPTASYDENGNLTQKGKDDIESNLAQSDVFGNTLNSLIYDEIKAYEYVVATKHKPTDYAATQLAAHKQDHWDAATQSASQAFQNNDFSFFDKPAGNSGKTYAQLYPKTAKALKAHIDGTQAAASVVETDNNQPVTQGESNGTQAPETFQTEAQGQEAPTASELSQETKAQIQGGIATLNSDDRESWAIQLERKLARKGSLTWQDIPQDLSNAVDTVSFAGLKAGIAQNPEQTIALIRGDQNNSVAEPVAQDDAPLTPEQIAANAEMDAAIDAIMPEITQEQAPTEPVNEPHWKEANALTALLPDSVGKAGKTGALRGMARDLAKKVPDGTETAKALKKLADSLGMGQGDVPPIKFAAAENGTSTISATEETKAPDSQTDTPSVEDVKAEQDAKEKQTTVNVPQPVSEAFTDTLQKQKARIIRLRNEATKAASLDKKLAAQTKVKDAEETLRALRREIFNAEDAAIEAIKSGNIGAFEKFAGLFPDAVAAIQSLISPKTQDVESLSDTAQTASEALETLVASTKTFFTEIAPIPIPTGSYLMNAPRPLVGEQTDDNNSEFITGRHYAVINPSGSYAVTQASSNIKNGAAMVLQASPAEQTEMALMVSSEYRSAYDEMPENERKVAVQSLIKRVQGKPYAEAIALLEAARANLAKPKADTLVATTHNGLKIYPTRIKSGDEVKTMWAVQTHENAERAKKGERELGGDRLADTLEGAKLIADDEIATKKATDESNAAIEAKEKAEADKVAADNAAYAASQVGLFIAGNTNYSAMQKGLAKKALSTLVTFRGKPITKSDLVEQLVAEGYEPTVELENKVQPMTRDAFNRATQQEQDAHDKRVKEGGKVANFYLAKGDHSYPIGIHQSDYAQYLLGQNDELDAETRYYENKATQPKQQPAPTPKPEAKAEPKVEPKADPLDAQAKAAKAKMFNALSKLASMAGKNTRMNWTPEEEQQLLPVVIELFDGAMELGQVTFKKAVRYVREFIASGIDQETADSIPYETLQGAYIAATGRHKDKSVTPLMDVAKFASIEDVYKDDESTAAPAETPVAENNDLPEGWTEAKADGMATNTDPVSGGIVDRELINTPKGIAEGKWFAISNAKGKLDGDFETRADAIAAIANAVSKPAETVATPLVTHITAKGKEIKGVVRTDLTLDQAKSIDPYTFKKDGGFFIREKHLDELNAAFPLSKAETGGNEVKPSLGDVAGRLMVSKAVADHLITDRFATIVQARQFITNLTGETIEPGTPLAKRADEAIELGVVIASRDIVDGARKQGRSDEVIFDRLLQIYENQPGLNVKDSTSLNNQAYSTPVPLAFVASRLAQVSKDKMVGEPTAGNGALMMEADPATAMVNEFEPNRIEALRSTGFNPTTNDAAAMEFPPKSLDSMVMNPPFGSLVDGTEWTFGEFTTNQIDHAIVLNSLEALKDDGNAVLIIGGTLARDSAEDAHKQAYRGIAKRSFFANLYSQYNVVDHFSVSGDLYRKQGAGFPVDVLVIRGRGKSNRPLPQAELPQKVDTWAQLKEKLNEQSSVGTIRQPNIGGDSGERGASPQPGPVSVDTNGASGSTSQGGTEGRSGSVSTPNGSGSTGSGTGSNGVSGQTNSPEQRGNDNAPEPQGNTGTDAEQGDGKQSDSNGNPQRNNPAGLGNGSGSGARTGLRLGGVLNVKGSNVASSTPKVAENKQSDENALQVPYDNFSENKSVNTLVATNHLGAIKEAFSRLMRRLGISSIDEYVRDELQYDPELFKASFSAEQVEALALAIDNIKRGKGFIVGDQTGIGKGRVVAAMIRYAKINGKTPVFVTQMPDLYGDMMRDLSDIGMGSTKPLMTNNNASVPLDAEALDWFSEKQAIQSHMAVLQEEIDNLAKEELGGKLKGLTSEQVEKEVKKYLKTAKNPEILSLKEEVAELKESIPARRGKFLETPNIEQHEDSLRGMVNGNSIGDYDVIFTTYNQLAALDSGEPKKNKETGQKTARKAPVFGYRNEFLKHFVNKNAMLILDESHNAGAADSRNPSKLGNVVRDFIDRSGSVFYSSATFAKNTDVMDAYSKTDLGLSFRTADDITQTLSSLPMQQVASRLLVEAGQYLRRERSFAGIDYETNEVVVSKQDTEDLGKAMSLMVAFDDAKKDAIKNIQNELDREGSVIKAIDGGGSQASVDSLNFTSVMHNVVNTFLLALKADATAQAAIDSISKGEKPVITVANTMEMFINEFAADRGLGMGDKFNATYADVLRKYLENTRKAKTTDANGNSNVHYLTDEELGFAGVDAYNDALDFIDSLELDVPISPIDHIKQRIEEAGYSIGEITGRQTVVVNGVLRPRNKAEQKTAGKKNTIAKFNNGGLDALIINRSGSTGLSMHASEKFGDQRRRVMIIGQAELDINNHMQMLGRINRTGQVTQGPFDDDTGARRMSFASRARMAMQKAARIGALREAANNKVYGGKSPYRASLTSKRIDGDLALAELPKVPEEDTGRQRYYKGKAASYGLPHYYQMTADVPIELRPAAVLAKKMAALNANTTADKKSAVEAGSLDFMNKYGDLVAVDVLMADPGLNAKLGFPVRVDVNGDIDPKGVIAKVTGRVGLLPLKDQSDLYQKLATEYKLLIEQLDAMGMNDLEAKTYPLDAKLIKTEELLNGTDDSPFTSAVTAESVNVRKLGKPYSSEKVRELIEKTLGGAVTRAASDAHYNATLDKYYKRIQSEIAAFEQVVAANESAAAVAIAKTRIEKLKTNQTRFREVLQSVGLTKVLKTDSGNFYGVVTDVFHSGDDVPTTLSAWKVRFAVVDGAKSITLPFTKIYTTNDSKVPEGGTLVDKATEMMLPTTDRTSFEAVSIFDAFDRGQTDSRENRVIVTGNLLRAAANGVQGRIMNYTDENGVVKQGILLPATDTIQAISGKFMPSINTYEQLETVISNDGMAIDKKENGDVVKIVKSWGDSVKIFLGKALGKKLVKLYPSIYFASAGGRFTAQAYRGEELKKFFDFLSDQDNGLNQRIELVPDGKTSKKVKSGEIRFSRKAGQSDIRMSRGKADEALSFSRTIETKATYEARIDALFDGERAAGPRQGVRVLDRSDILDMLGFGAKPLNLAEGKVGLNQDNHPHMTAAVWKKVPEWLENPAAVFDSDTVKGSLVFIAPETVNGSTVRMTVVPRPDGSADVSILTNAYDAQGFSPFARWFNSGLGKYVNKKIFPMVLEQSGLRLPSSTYQNQSGTLKILTEKNLVGYQKAHYSRGNFFYSALTKSVQGLQAKQMMAGAWEMQLQGLVKKGAIKQAELELTGLPDWLKLQEGKITKEQVLGYLSSDSLEVSGMPQVKVREIVDVIRSTWKNSPDVVVASNMNDPIIPQAVRDADRLQKSQGAVGDAEGFVYGGKVYVVASEMNAPQDVVRVLFHEALGHMGLRGVYGNSLKQVLNQVILGRRKEVIAKAISYGLDPSNNDDLLQAAEEVLAEMAQTRPELGFVQRAIAAIRNFLRTHVSMFKNMQFSDADIIQAFILPARRFVENGGGDGGGGGLRYLRAFHGTPHNGIEKFNTEKIGTGEGAQAYGWGLYFASKKEIAEWYRNSLSTVTPAHNTFDGKRITKKYLAELQQSPENSVREFFGSKAANRATGITNIAPALDDAIERAQEARDYYQERLDGYLANPPFASTYSADHYRNLVNNYDKYMAGLEALKGRLGFKKQSKNGQLYEVEIPEESEMLDWDKPLSEQPEGVRKALEQILASDAMDAENKAVAEKAGDGITGRLIYSLLETSDNTGSARAASLALANAGIKGIKYLDGTTRNSSKDSHNYVIFDGADVAIEKTHFSRNGQLLAPNGKPSKLSEGQWHQVRSTQFKAWFGDWESAAILNGEALATLKTSDAPTGGFKDVEDWAASVFAKQGGKAVRAGIGEILLDHRAAQTSMAHGGATKYKKVAFAAVKDVIERGALVHQSSTPEEDSFYFSAPVDIDGVTNIETVLVHRDVNTKRMYLHSVTTKENLLNQRVSSADAEAPKRSGSTNSEGIAILLQNIINRKGISKAVDPETGEPMVVYHGTLNDISTFAPSDFYGSGYFGKGINLTSSAQDASKYASKDVGVNHDLGSKASVMAEKMLMDYTEAKELLTSGNGTVYPLFSSMKNPLRIDSAQLFVPEKVLRTALSEIDYQDDPDVFIRQFNRSGDGIKQFQFVQNRRATQIYRQIASIQNKDGLIIDGSISPKSGGAVHLIALDSTQVKSAIGNNGDFDGKNPDIRFSRTPLANANFSVGAQRTLQNSIMNRLNDLWRSSGKVTFWNKSVGTQYHLSESNSEYKRTFDAVQRFISDTSIFANKAADLAPTMLPKLDKLKDLVKKALPANDVKAVSNAVFGGTLHWSRDAAGKLVEQSAVLEAAAKMSVHDKADALMRDKKISPNVLKMWQGMPMEQYESLINSKYENDVLRPGVVFTPTELKDKFGMTDAQIGLYQEFRKATDKSLTDLALSEMVRMGSADLYPISDIIMEHGDVKKAADDIAQYLESMKQLKPEREAALSDTIEKVQALADRALDLMNRGYAPLMRFGKYAVYAKGANGEQLFFGMYESQREANWAETALRKHYPQATISSGIMSQEQHKLFQGVSPETLALFGDAMGLDTDSEKAAIYQEFVKLVADSKSTLRRMLNRKGVPGYSEDATRVLAGFITSNSRKTASNLNSYEISKSVEEIKAGDVLDEAIKLKNYVQNPEEEAQWIRGVLFTQYIGGSVASAMVNLTQSLTMTFPYLSQFTTVADAGARMAKAASMAGSGKGIDAELKVALKRAEDDGVVAPQEIHQLMAHAQGNGGLKSGDGTRMGDAMAMGGNALSMVALAWGSMFSAAEVFNRNAAFIAAYQLARDNPKLGDPFAFAEKTVKETQGIYNCVDESTECLTKDGWKHHSDLVVGESVYAVDQATGELVESKLVNVHRHHNKAGIPATEFRNSSGFSMVLTDDHTCLVQNYSSRDKKYQRIMSVKAKDVKIGHHFVRTPQGDATGRVAVYSDDEVRLLAWVASEGHQFAHRNVKEKRGIGLVQSNTHNPQYVIEIDNLLNRMGGHFNRKTSGAKRADQMVCWQLRKELWEKINVALPGKMLTHKLVSELTIPQMRIFLDTFTKGDGHFPDEGGPTITQKDVGNLSVLQAMAVLSGQSSTLYNRMGEHDFGVLYLAKTSKRAYRKQMVLTPLKLDMVWCPQTEHGTWIARRNGRTFVTGNSGNKPAWARGAVGSVLFTFKQFSISYVEFLQRMYANNGRNGQEGKKAMWLALGVLVFTAGISGLPGGDDLDDVIDAIAQAMGYNFSTDQWKQEVVEKLGSPAAAQFVLHGLTGLPGSPIDISGRMGLGNLIPGTGFLLRKDDHTRDVQEMFGPISDLLSRTFNAGGEVFRGNVLDAAKEISPVAARNVVKGVDMLNTGMYRDAGGRKVIETDTTDAISKMAGFQPRHVAQDQKATFAVQKMSATFRMVKSEIVDEFAVGRFERDQSKIDAARNRLQKWNEKNPSTPMRITVQQVNSKVQNMNKTKAQRMIAAAPKEVKAAVRRELAEQ